MCENRDLGSGQSGTLCSLKGSVAVDVGVVFPWVVKKMILTQARMVHWKKWAATHECEVLKEEVWLEPSQAVHASLDRQAQNCDEEAVSWKWWRKLFYDICWSDEKKCRGCTEAEGTEWHRLHHFPCWREAVNQIPETLCKLEQRAKTS